MTDVTMFTALRRLSWTHLGIYAVGVGVVVGVLSWAGGTTSANAMMAGVLTFIVVGSLLFLSRTKPGISEILDSGFVSVGIVALIGIGITLAGAFEGDSSMVTLGLVPIGIAMLVGLWRMRDSRN